MCIRDRIVVDSEGQTKMEEIKDLHFPAEECLKMCGEDIEIEVRLKDPTKAPKAPEKKEEKKEEKDKFTAFQGSGNKLK